MKFKRSSKWYVFVGLVLVLSACTQKPAPTPELVPEEQLPEVTQAPEIPEATEVPIETEEGPEIPVFDESLVMEGSWMYWFDNSILLYIPAGDFLMGAQDVPNNPPRTVSLSSYWIYRYPVTMDMYRQCVVAGACEPPASEPPYESVFDPLRAHHPVVGVDWEKAQSYCQWMNADLPTEAQWEKAARGPDGNTYPWGEDEPDCSLLNYQGCVGDTTPVQAYYPEGMSYYELFDTAGNTYEWARDWYQEDYYTLNAFGDPFGPETGTYRSIRGSSFESPLEILPLANRAYLQPEKYRIDLGFRCVVTEPAKFAPFCVQTAYIPGENKGPGQPPPGQQDVILQQVDGCLAPAPAFSYGSYCYNQANQIGGATVTYSGNLQSVNGASCDNQSPLGCWGTEGASFEVVLCTECSDWIPPDVQNPSCDPGYQLVGSECVFQGIPAIPATTCPSGWFLDADGYCHPWLMIADPDCPDGYSYDQTAQCCTRTFIEPSGGWAGVPSASYSSCPVGYDYYDPPGVCVFGGMWVVDQSCKSFTAQLGYCRDEKTKCTNPGQYNTQSSCEAAGCTWNPDVTGGPGGSCSN